jgi:hypothetical protein
MYPWEGGGIEPSRKSLSSLAVLIDSVISVMLVALIFFLFSSSSAT